jgi:FG-GAP repeat
MFGASVALTDDELFAAVGANQTNSASQLHAGAVHVFTRSTTTDEFQHNQVIAMPSAGSCSSAGFGSQVTFVQRAPDSASSTPFLVASAPHTSSSVGTDVGQVIVFHRPGSSYVQSQTIDKPNEHTGDRFGTSIASGLDYFAVSAPHSDSSPFLSVGTVYTYSIDDESNTTFVLDQVFSPPTGEACSDMHFGASIAVAPTAARDRNALLAIGAPGKSSATGLASGAVYIYSYSYDSSQFEYATQLSIATLQSGDHFGSSVAVAKSRVMVGAPGKDSSTGLDAGAAWLFVRQGAIPWSEGPTVITVPTVDVQYGDHFGQAVSLDSSSAVLSMPGADSATRLDSGAVGFAQTCEQVYYKCEMEPPAPLITFSDVVVENGKAYYRIVMKASYEFDQYVKVEFPEANNSSLCDYPESEISWEKSIDPDDACMNVYTGSFAMTHFLAECGFEQQVRTGGTAVFVQTVTILTNRTCDDSDGDRVRTVYRTSVRDSEFTIEVSSFTNITAAVNGLEIFGSAFKLDVLGDLTITPDLDTNMPTITGYFVTETQHPYELQEPQVQLSGDFDFATWTLTGTYCTADNTNRPACQQTWSYSFQPNQTCPDKAQLEDELVQVSWRVNCSDGFDGECAPSFAVQPEATFSLNSPVYCISSDYIQLTPSLEVYQYDDINDNVADFGAASLGTLDSNSGFSVERVFTIDSQCYAEFTVLAGGTGVTLTSTVLKKVSTTTSSRGELVLFTVNDVNISTKADTFVWHDVGFGTTESSDFADTRTRFQFTWLNDTTVLLDSTEDLAQTVSLTATTISTFTSVEELDNANIDRSHPFFSKLNADRHSKEREDVHIVLFDEDGSAPRQSRSTVFGRVYPASPGGNPNGAATASSSSGFVMSPAIVAGAVAVIAVVALAIFAATRRNNKREQQSAVAAFSNQQPVSAQQQQYQQQQLLQMQMLQQQQQQLQMYNVMALQQQQQQQHAMPMSSSFSTSGMPMFGMTSTTAAGGAGAAYQPQFSASGWGTTTAQPFNLYQVAAMYDASGEGNASAAGTVTGTTTGMSTLPVAMHTE